MVILRNLDYDIIWGGECSAKDLDIDDLKKKFELYTKLIYKKLGQNVTRSETVKNIEVGGKKEKCFC